MSKIVYNTELPTVFTPVLLLCLYLLLPPIQAVINAVLSSGCVGPDIKHSPCYGLLLKHLKSSAIHWLHPDLTVSELTQRYEQQHLEAEWRSVVCVVQASQPVVLLWHHRQKHCRKEA